MNIRCPSCKRLFDYDPASGPARCTYEDCGWAFRREEQAPPLPAAPVVAVTVQDQAPAESLDIIPPPHLPAPQYTGRSIKNHDRYNPVVGTMRCPSCRKRIPDDAVICPRCGIDTDREFGRQEGVRAMFDVYGDITFTPKMVALLFVATLAAFLTFTWIISRNGNQDEFVPITLSGAAAGDGSGGGHLRSLQGTEFAQLKREFLDARTTDLRRDVLREKFTGERVIWNGIVTGVERDGQDYMVSVVMDDPDSHGYVSLRASSHEANERRIANLRRGEQVMFSGTIEQFRTGGAYDPLDFFRVELINGLLLN